MKKYVWSTRAEPSAIAINQPWPNAIKIVFAPLHIQKAWLNRLGLNYQSSMSHAWTTQQSFIKKWETWVFNSITMFFRRPSTCATSRCQRDTRRWNLTWCAIAWYSVAVPGLLRCTTSAGWRNCRRGVEPVGSELHQKDDGEETSCF